MAQTSLNPLVALGNLNRLRGTVQFDDFPQLNVTASYLGREGIGLRRLTPAGEFIPVMVGGVASPAPFQQFETTIHMLRTLPLATLWELQLQASGLIGTMTVRLDVSSGVHPPYTLYNAMLINVDPYRIDGTEPGYVPILQAYYPVNNDLWSA